MRVVLSPHAQLRLDEIFARLSAISATSATRTIERITQRAWQLELFPDSGRIVPEFDNPYIRELIEGDYRIIYERFADRIEVISVLSGRMASDV